MQNSKDNIHFFRNNAQLIYTVALLILIPGALIFNTYLFFSNTNKIMKVELNKKADLANDIFSANITNLIDSPSQINDLIKTTINSNSEIYAIDVLVPEGDDYVVIASSDQTIVGEVSKLYYHSLAWRGNDAIAFETSSSDKSTIKETQIGNEKYWVVINTVVDSVGNKVALSSIKISSEVVDELINDNLMRGLLVVGATLIIVILLILNNMSLFKYALRFKKLKEVDEMKDEFISMASHELRAPITGIRGYLAMILDGSFGQLPDEAQVKLDLVSKESDRLHDLVEDLLEVSRIQQGRVSLELKSLALSSIVDSVANMFRQKAKDKNLELNIEIKDNLPNILADESRLSQIMVNLISNSIKYTMAGSVTISAELKIDKVDTIKIKVSDTGMGMSAKDREKLFQKFYRVQNEKTDKIVGTGLGLWITKELVEMMKGKIYVDSIENKGTEFTVFLPVYKEDKK
ncbi:MAG: HAMP domain-containing sensor histidine kinase [bacterium]|nr:HAMP domain-containing sensor histidine kinase [bacterium]